jgi:hypothetical protein
MSASLSFEEIKRKLKEAIFRKTNYRPGDNENPRTIVGNDDVLIELIDDEFFQGRRHFPDDGLDGNDTVTKLALAIEDVLNQETS